MQTIHIDVPFEVRKMELREVMPPMFDLPLLILRDKRGKWLFDPFMVGIDQSTALKQAHRWRKPVYELECHMFAELDWLLSEAMRPYRKTMPTEDGEKSIPFDAIAEMFISLAAKVPGEFVSVKMIRRVPDVFSVH